MRFLLKLGAIGIIGSLSLTNARADILLDTFDSENPGVSDTYDNIAIWDSSVLAPNRWRYQPNILGYGGANPFPAQTTRMRTNSGGTVSFSDGDAYIVSGAPGAGKYIRGTSYRNTFPGLTNSDQPDPALRLETILLALNRDFSDGEPYDATGLNYIRFTAWREPDDLTNPQVARRKYLQPGTKFYIGLVDDTFGVSCGPQSGGVVSGLNVTTAPQVFVVGFSTLDRDPILKQLATQVPAVDYQSISSVLFGYRHEGPNTDTLNSGLFVHPDFFIDDVVMSEQAPSVVFQGLDFVLDEAIPGDFITVLVALTALPVADVTLTPATTNLDQGVITSGPVTFTPANWSTPQEIVVQVVDDANADGDTQFAVEFAVASADLFYAGLTGLRSPAITALDNEPAPEAVNVLIDNFDQESPGVSDGAGNIAVWDSAPGALNRWRALGNESGLGGPDPFPAQSTRLRTVQAGGLELTAADAFIETGPTTGSLSVRGSVEFSGFAGLANSDVTTASLRLEAGLVAVVRDPSREPYDVGGGRYLRFTAWREPDASAPHAPGDKYLQPGTMFNIWATDAAGGLSTGPQSGGILSGLDIQTQPRAFVIPLDSLGADAVLAALPGQNTPPADLALLKSIGFGFRRSGANLDPDNPALFTHPDFHVDDVFLLGETPGLRVTGDDLLLDEAVIDDTIFLRLALTAPPTADVSVTAASLDATEGAIPGGPLVFTPQNWSSEQLLAVQVVDDGVNDGDIPFQIQFALTSDDLVYGELPVVLSPTVVTKDRGANTPAPNAALTWAAYE